MHEDFAGNLPQMVLALVAAPVLVVLWARGRRRGLIPYSAGLWVAWLGYHVWMRWQPWASRLHTPVFVLAAPLLALAVNPGGARSGRRDLRWICLLVCLYGLPYAFQNGSRPLVGRGERDRDRRYAMFASQDRPMARVEEAEALRALLEARGVSRLGWMAGGNSYEYPYWAILNRGELSPPRVVLVPVGVENETAGMGASAAEVPEWVLAVDGAAGDPAGAERVWRGEFAELWRRGAQEP